MNVGDFMFCENNKYLKNPKWRPLNKKDHNDGEHKAAGFVPCAVDVFLMIF